MRSIRVLLASSAVVLHAFATQAQGQGAIGPTWTEGALLSSGLRGDRSVLLSKVQEAPSAIHLPGPEPTAPTQISLVGSAVVVEVGRMMPDGRFVRPRLNIGMQSQGLKNWMAGIGLPAQNCMAPAFRGRLKRSAETNEVGATFMVSARCTFY
jgi:hypothetical protein